MKKILINAAQKEELRVAIIDGKKLIDLNIDTLSSERKKGNIYKGKIARIEPGLDAVFVEYGEPKHGFLPFREIAPAYYKNNQPDGTNNATVAKGLRQGQSLLVQVQRENRENKGAAMTTFISLAGRYLVLMPNSPRPGGVSRRIGEKDRNSMRDMLAQLNTGDDKLGIIARTQGVGRNLEALQQDFDNLKKLWDSVVTTAKSRPAPFLVYQESNIAICALRDHFSDDIEKIMIDNEKIYQDARDFIQLVMPEQAEKLNLYQEPVPLFEHYDIEDQIEAAFHRTIPLPSGGSLVLDHTEALLSIDINSGKATKAGNIEETALNTNLEAAEEVALQLRLRDLGGLIVIDFIDMESMTNRKKVEDRLYKATRVDQARVQFDRISSFGLLEMSRQRLRPSLSESNHVTCPRCEGKGIVRNLESGALMALRMMEKEAIGENGNHVVAHLPIETASFLLNRKRGKINEIEMRHNVKLVVIPDAHISTPNIQIQKHVGNEHFRKPERKHKPLAHRHYLSHDEKKEDAPVLGFLHGAAKPARKPGFLSRVFASLPLGKGKTEGATAGTEKKKSDRKQQRQASGDSAARRDGDRGTRRRSSSSRRSNQRRGAYAETSERRDEARRRDGGNRNGRSQRRTSAPRRQAAPRNRTAPQDRSTGAASRQTRDVTRDAARDAGGSRPSQQWDSPAGEAENRTPPPVTEAPAEKSAASEATPPRRFDEDSRQKHTDATSRQPPGADSDQYNQPWGSFANETENKATSEPPVMETPAEKTAASDSVPSQKLSEDSNRKQESYTPPRSSRISHLKQVETKLPPKA